MSARGLRLSADVHILSCSCNCMGTGGHTSLPCEKAHVELSCQSREGLQRPISQPREGRATRGRSEARSGSRSGVKRKQEATFYQANPEQENRKGRGRSPGQATPSRPVRGRSVNSAHPWGPRRDRSRPHWAHSPGAGAAFSSDPSVFCGSSSLGPQLAPGTGRRSG